jgi:hypothetical protein
LDAGEQGDVVAGHGRLAAARLLGLSEVPVISVHDLTELQRRQLMLADNRIALNAGWDLEMLTLELKDLSALGADLAGGLTDEDDVPEVAQTAVSQAGDIWGLGPHRLACGDATDPALTAALLDELKPNLMTTDPPYSVEYDPSSERRAGRLGCRMGTVSRRYRLPFACRFEIDHRGREPGA